jgi:hypothetical protein
MVAAAAAALPTVVVGVVAETTSGKFMGDDTHST